MSYEFTVSVEVQKTEGKFASRDDIETELLEALEGADPSSISPGDSEYETVSWEVEAAPETTKSGKPKKDPQLRVAVDALRDMHERLTHAKNMDEVTEDLKLLSRRIDGLTLALYKTGGLLEPKGGR